MENPKRSVSGRVSAMDMAEFLISTPHRYTRPRVAKTQPWEVDKLISILAGS